MTNRTSLLLQKTNIAFNQTHMLGCCGQIQDRIGRERCHLIRDPSKLAITSNFNNMKPAKQIHLVYLVHCGPNVTHFMFKKMSDCGKADLPAVCHKEDMPIDKENININAHLLLELY
jgi:hypothetical protein